MTAGLLRFWLGLALQLRCVDLLALPPGRGTPGGSDASRLVSDKLEALFNLKDLPPGPAVADHKKAPQFMLDLYNAVSDGTPGGPKQIPEGNVVRSFEDRGE